MSTRAAADSVLVQQSSLQEETLRLATACSDLEAITKDRQEELERLSGMLERVRAARAGTSPIAADAVSRGGGPSAVACATGMLQMRMMPLPVCHDARLTPAPFPSRLARPDRRPWPARRCSTQLPTSSCLQVRAHASCCCS